MWKESFWTMAKRRQAVKKVLRVWAKEVCIRQTRTCIFRRNKADIFLRRNEAHGVLLFAKNHRLNMDINPDMLDIFGWVEEKNEETLRTFGSIGLLTERLVNRRRSFANKKVNMFEASPLLLACALGYTNIAEILLKHGACVNGVNELGESPLFIASKEGDLDVVKLLLNQKGVEVDLQSYFGETPLLAAGGQLEVIRLLVEKGANLTYQVPRTGETVFHSCSASTHETAIDALSYLIDGVPKSPPIVRNASGSLPVISAAAQGKDKIVQFWTERARTQIEVEQAADAWELLALKKLYNFMPSLEDEIENCWTQAISLRTANTDMAQLSQILHKKQARCATVTSSQTCGPLVDVLEFVEGEICEADTDDERKEMMSKPLTDVINCAATQSSLEPVLQQWCLCSERVLGLAQKEIQDSRLAYAKWLLVDQSGREEEAAKLMLDFMQRQQEELDKRPGINHFFAFSLRSFLKLWLKEKGLCGDPFKWVGLELVKLTALAVERCQKRIGNWLERYCLLVYFLEIVRIFFLSDERTADQSGEDLVETLDVTVVDAVRRCIHADRRGLYNQTMLHIAMDSHTGQVLSNFGFCTDPTESFPHTKLSLLLVELKAPVNEPDKRGYLPLHLLLENRVAPEDNRVLPILQCLVRAKSHLCICNWNGESCLDLAEKSSLRDSLMPALRKPQPLPLLCLVAQFIRCSFDYHYLLQKVKCVLPQLVQFVRRH